MKKALGYLEKMLKDYPDDFFCRHKRSFKNFPALKPDPKIKQQDPTEVEKEEAANLDSKVNNCGKMLRDIRSIYEATTEFFDGKQTPTEDQKNEEIGNAEFWSKNKGFVHASDLSMSQNDSAKLEYRDLVRAHVDVVADIVQNKSKDAIELPKKYQDGRHGPQCFVWRLLSFNVGSI